MDFKIPEGIILSVPEDLERACFPPEGIVAFNWAIVAVINGFLVHQLIAQFLYQIGCAPTQFAPNLYQVLVGMTNLQYKFYETFSTLEDFLFFYTLRTSPDQSSWYYVAAHQDVDKLIVDLLSNQKN